MTGPDTTTTHWIKRLATLIHEIRPEWAEPGIASALTKVADRPLADVAIAAIQAATTRTDQRTPAIIAMGGSHWGTHGGLTIAHRPQLIPLLISARLVLDWQHARKARR